MQSNTHGLKKGDKLTINAGVLEGAPAKFIRQSPRTSECIVELLEDRGTAWHKGDRVQVKQWEMS